MKKSTRMIIAIGMIAMLALSVFALTGCGSSGGSGGEEAKTDWEYIEDKGKVIVGLDDTFAPMGFRDENNEIVGFDIDLAKAVFGEMGLEVEFKATRIFQCPRDILRTVSSLCLLTRRSTSKMLQS